MEGRASAEPAAESGLTYWERAWAVSERWTALALLSFSTLVSVLPAQPWSIRSTTVGLAALAAAWIVVGHTTAPKARRELPGHAPVFLVGLLALAALLMSRDIMFFVFAISGFFHAAALRPFPLVFAGTGATSFLILFFTWGGIPPALDELVMFLSILGIQTLLIGFGVAGGERMTELSEQRRRAVGELTATLAENEALQTRLVDQARRAGVDHERQRMAREIHDTLAQGLIGVITQLEAAEQADDDPAARRRHLDHAATLARESLTEARRSVQALAPGALERGRLPDALDQLVRDFSQLHGIEADATAIGGAVTLPADIEVALLRVTQEALANVAKHADATRVGVTVSMLDDQVVLDVRDDGCGFDTAAEPAGTSFGLTSMRERMHEIGGTLTVESRPGDGTAVSATIPIVVREETDA